MLFLVLATVASVAGGPLELCPRPWDDGAPPPIVAGMSSVGPDACVCDPAAAPFGGGAGTLDDPVTLCTPRHLDALRGAPEANARLCDDIDLAGLPFLPIPVRAGDLDGNAHAICNWSYRGTEESLDGFVLTLDGAIHDLIFTDFELHGGHGAGGLFYETTDRVGVLVEDVYVSGVVRGDSGHLGGIARAVWEGATIRRAHWNGTVEATYGDFVGAVLDSCAGECTQLVAEGQVIGLRSYKVSGLVQQVLDEGRLTESVSRATVRGYGKVGGLVAVLQGGLVQDCAFEGAAQADNLVGGLVAETYRAPGQLVDNVAVGRLVARRSTPMGLIGSDGAVAEVDGSAWVLGTTRTLITDGGGEPVRLAELRDPEAAPFVDWGPAWDHVPGFRPRLVWEVE